jgi:hypothetical protein
MTCQECANKVKQGLLSNIYDALLKQFEVLVTTNVMNIIMDFDEVYNGNHGIILNFMDRKYYITVHEVQ